MRSAIAMFLLLVAAGCGNQPSGTQVSAAGQHEGNDASAAPRGGGSSGDLPIEEILRLENPAQSQAFYDRAGGRRYRISGEVTAITPSEDGEHLIVGVSTDVRKGGEPTAFLTQLLFPRSRAAEIQYLPGRRIEAEGRLDAIIYGQPRLTDPIFSDLGPAGR